MENNQPILVKRVKKIAGGHHGGAWKIAFADFATAMMAFFLLMWLLNATTEEQRHGLADTQHVLGETGPGEDLGLDLLVLDDPVLLGVDEEHPPRLQPALGDDVGGGSPGVVVGHAGHPGHGLAGLAEHPEELALPRTLWDAAQRLKGSQAARELFGDAFVEHFAASREWEEREYRRHVSDWELDRYFEII